MRQRQSVLLWLIGVTFVFYMLQLFLHPWFTNLFVLDSEGVLVRPWILVTHIFLHANFNHIFFNMYGLFLFGTLLEAKIGSKRLLALYFTGGILAAVISVLIYQFVIGQQFVALGASAAVFAVIGALIVLMPDLQLLFLFLIPMRLWVAGIIWMLMDVGGLFFPNNGIGNIAHLSGMAFGLAVGYCLKGKRKEFQQKFTSKVYMSASDVDEYIKHGRL